ncbi:hypothetical protein CGGC5_v017169 [Colletotrichum fructicola Nara gc5]|uniref:Secreted protein n=1 Tax=Colletotrichum fructicola (strain Nara gc5) TaxID=1213859 RepID=A0A7J6IE77_COLFN|nr:hypothetical protein CGGC5_v017169 [Colletotrichum fructicola Nara gc5]KAF4881348.1 hypothetical protein CGCFRS4_v015644 [Colletotrichum fructicola]
MKLKSLPPPALVCLLASVYQATGPFAFNSNCSKSQRPGDCTLSSFACPPDLSNSVGPVRKKTALMAIQTCRQPFVFSFIPTPDPE